MVEEIDKPDPRKVAQAVVRAYCGWLPYPNREESFQLDGSGARILQIPTMRITAITRVVENSTDITSMIEWSRGGVLRCGRPFTDRLGAIKVTATHGWNLEEIPDLASVLAQVSARVAAPMSNISSRGAGPFSISYATVSGIPVSGTMLIAPEREILDKYRLVWGP